MCFSPFQLQLAVNIGDSESIPKRLHSQLNLAYVPDAGLLAIPQGNLLPQRVCRRHTGLRAQVCPVDEEASEAGSPERR